MEMKNKINILGVEWQIVMVDDMMKVDSDRRNSMYGQVHWDEREIRLFSDSPESVFATLIHEILHVIDFELKTKMSHDNVSRISVALGDTLLRNDFIKEFSSW